MDLNDNQKYALTRALQDGEHKRQERGLKRPLRGSDCSVPVGYRSPIAAPTRRSLHQRGLITNTGWSNHLTTEGFRLAKRLFDEELREDGGVKMEEPEAPGIVYTPTNVAEYITAVRKLNEAMAKAHKDKVAKAVRLWRNIRLPDAHWGANSKAVSSAIRFEFNRERYGTSLDLDLDDLIHIGEQIEKLRQG